eukprot:scaffold9498_cov79-Phaeocystis_antarctica.AAC.5
MGLSQLESPNCDCVSATEIVVLQRSATVLCCPETCSLTPHFPGRTCNTRRDTKRLVRANAVRANRYCPPGPWGRMVDENGVSRTSEAQAADPNPNPIPSPNPSPTLTLTLAQTQAQP